MRVGFSPVHVRAQHEAAKDSCVFCQRGNSTSPSLLQVTFPGEDRENGLHCMEGVHISAQQC